MPQTLVRPITVQTLTGTYSPLTVDAQGSLKTASGGDTPRYNITASTVVKAAPGRLVRINVVVAGTAAGNVYDVAVAANAAAANLISTIPNAVGTMVLDWQCATGITIIPGAGQTVNVSYI